ncbi:MAG: rhomboid family intramembrane serine protease [Actinomycetales bacterium]|nr:rhomboid family intramembrane serine protease [Actinomycetales bacterium]
MSADEVSPDVCYRHPDRASWTLCERCGRTICPECQILTPQGVRCPDCVRETGGSVTWQRAGTVAKTSGKPRGRAGRPARASARANSSGGSSRIGAAIGEMLRPGSTTPVLSWGAVAVALVLWITGFVLSNFPFAFLAASPSVGVQVWRYVTSWAVYPAGLDLSILSILLNVVFFLLIAPGVERFLGRAKFAAVFLASASLSASAMVLAGGISYGLFGALFGLFGAYLILLWHDPVARVRALVILGINVLFTLVLGASFLPAIVGGVIGGAGATFLLRLLEDRPGTRPSTRYLIVAAACALFVVLAVVRSLAG